MARCQQCADICTVIYSGRPLCGECYRGEALRAAGKLRRAAAEPTGPVDQHGAYDALIKECPHDSYDAVTLYGKRLCGDCLHEAAVVIDHLDSGDDLEWLARQPQPVLGFVCRALYRRAGRHARQGSSRCEATGSVR